MFWLVRHSREYFTDTEISPLNWVWGTRDLEIPVHLPQAEFSFLPCPDSLLEITTVRKLEFLTTEQKKHQQNYIFTLTT